MVEVSSVSALSRDGDAWQVVVGRGIWQRGDVRIMGDGDRFVRKVLTAQGGRTVGVYGSLEEAMG